MNYKIVCLLFSIIILSSCTTIGAHYLPHDRASYNSALAQSNDQQLLLNLVRLKYGLSSYFLQVSNVTAQLSFSSSSTAGIVSHVRNGTFPLNDLSLNTNLSYLEKPTISYTPLQDQQFTVQILTPISVNKLYLLLRSGWSFARVFRICVQRLGPLLNAPSASRPTSSHAPQYKTFVNMVHYLRELQRDNDVDFNLTKIKNYMAIDIHFLYQHHHQRKWQQLLKMLHVNGHYQNLIFVSSFDINPHDNIIPIRTRSFSGSMYYLSKAVEVPLSAFNSGAVEHTYSSNGSLFDWANVTKGMLVVHSSLAPPSDAAIEINFKGLWFYIANSDNDSKSTIAMLNQLFALQSGKLQSNAPLLTINT